MQHHLRNVVLVCLCIVPFLAWFVADGRLFDFIPSSTSGLFFPFITGKNFAFRFVVEIAFIAWIFLASRFPEYRPRMSKLFITYAVFIGVLFVADMFGVDPLRSFFSNYERMEGFVTHLHLFAYFVMLVSVLRGTLDWDRFLKVLLASNVIVLLWGYFQLFGSRIFFVAKLFPAFAEKMSAAFPIHMSDYRLDSTLGNSAYFAIYTAMFAFICGLFFVRAATRNAKILYGVLAVLNLIALFYTATRGTILAIIAGVIVMFIFLAIRGDHREKKAAYAVFGLILAFVILFFAAKDSQFVKDNPILYRFASIRPSEITTLSRLTIWKMSYEGWKARPILGYGQDNFGYVFTRYYNPVMYDQEPYFDRSHNVFFDWLVAGGILGLLAYLSLFGMGVYLIVKKKGDLNHKEQALLLGLFATYFLHNIFVFDNLISYIVFFTMLAYIAFRTEGAAMHRNHLGNQYGYIIEPLAVLFVLTMFWYAVYKPYVANTLIIKGIDVNRLVQQMPIDKVLTTQLDAFKQAIALNSFGTEEAREQFVQLGARLYSYNPNITDPAMQKSYLDARNTLLLELKKEIDTVAEETKDDVRQYTLFGGFFNTVHDYVDAQIYLGQAHAISPKKQLVSFDLMTALLGQGKYAEAYQLGLETYSYAPKYAAAQNAYAVASVYAKKEADAEKIFKQNGQVFPLSPEVINAYITAGNTQKALTLLAQYKKDHPDEATNVDQIIKYLLSPKK